MHNRKNVAILVPIYRRELNPLEEISFDRLKRMLGKYPVFFVNPDSLDIHELIYDTGFGSECFPDKFFKGIEAYSELCTSKELYLRFSDYKYILIYQLDAFVFQDDLSFFLNLSYDYYGAPIPERIWPYLTNKVGSGGLSLRRTEAVLRVLDDKPLIMEKMKSIYPKEEIDKTVYLEDRFFAFCGQSEDIDFSVPDKETAFKFAVEFNVDDVYSGLSERLPFGCHKWYAENFDFWWPIIREYGYSLTDREICKWTCDGAEHERWIRCEELASGEYRAKLREFLKNIINSDLVRLWGNGDVGKSARKILDALGFPIEVVYDRGENRFNAINTEMPTRENIEKSVNPIIICVKNATSAIEDMLKNMGYETRKDFFQWVEIEKMIIKEFDDKEE